MAHPELAASIARTLATLGTLEPQVLTRDPNPSPITVRLVRRPGGGVLFATQGLSFGEAALGYELGVEVAGAEPTNGKTFAACTNAELANAWPVHALWFLSDAYAQSGNRLLDDVEQFGLVTALIPPLPGLERCVTPKGYVGVLHGIALDGPAGAGRLGQSLLAEHGGVESRLVLLTVLTADEMAHVTSAADGTHAAEVVKRLAQRGAPHVSSAVRPSVLA